MSERFDAVIVGAGPAGLATGRELQKRGIRAVILEKGPEPAWVWKNLYESLRLHTGKHLSALPGKRFRRRDPIFVSRERFCDYLDEYSRDFDLDLRTDREVVSSRRQDGGWITRTTEGDEFVSPFLVVATGIVSGPVTPEVEGLDSFGGITFHSREYRRPSKVPGVRILVMGVGNSGAEIASELGAAGRDVAISVRSGANVVPLTLAGLPIQYVAAILRRLPRALRELVVGAVRRIIELRRGPPLIPRPDYGPLDRIPVIGFHLDDAIRRGEVRVLPGVERLIENGARFVDGRELPFDTVIFATGYRPPLRFLPRVSTDERGFAARSDRVRSSDHPDLYFVGHNYDSTGGLRNIFTDSQLAADAIATRLAAPQQPVGDSTSRRYVQD